MHYEPSECEVESVCNESFYFLRAHSVNGGLHRRRRHGVVGVNGVLDDL
jgi:hypothetical protein